MLMALMEEDKCLILSRLWARHVGMMEEEQEVIRDQKCPACFLILEESVRNRTFPVICGSNFD